MELEEDPLPFYKKITKAPLDKKNIPNAAVENQKVISSLKITKKYIQLKINEWEQEADFLVYTLSGLETCRVFPKLLPLLFPCWEEPVKIWRRFSLSWEPGQFKNIIPLMLWIEQPTGDDTALSLKRHPTDSSRLDLWMLCPYAERFNKELLEPALARLNRLFPGFCLKALQKQPRLNQEYFVLYKNHFTAKKPLRVFSLNPESCGKLDAYSLMQESESVLQKIKQLFV